jgi:hypothetical protein
MDKNDARLYAEGTAGFIRQSENLPGLSEKTEEIAALVEDQMRSVKGLDLVSAAVVLSTIGEVDSRAANFAYSMGVPMSELKEVAIMALSYLRAAHAIFTSEGVLDTLEDHFAKGAKEGS